MREIIKYYKLIKYQEAIWDQSKITNNGQTEAINQYIIYGGEENDYMFRTGERAQSVKSTWCFS